MKSLFLILMVAIMSAFFGCKKDHALSFAEPIEVKGYHLSFDVDGKHFSVNDSSSFYEKYGYAIQSNGSRMKGGPPTLIENFVIE